MKGDKGKVGFIGKNMKAIDYILTKERIRNRMEKMEVSIEKCSEHIPVIATLKCSGWLKN